MGHRYNRIGVIIQNATGTADFNLRRAILATISITRSQIFTTATLLVLSLNANVTSLSPLGAPPVGLEKKN